MNLPRAEQRGVKPTSKPPSRARSIPRNSPKIFGISTGETECSSLCELAGGNSAGGGQGGYPPPVRSKGTFWAGASIFQPRSPVAGWVEPMTRSRKWTFLPNCLHRTRPAIGVVSGGITEGHPATEDRAQRACMSPREAFYEADRGPERQAQGQIHRYQQVCPIVCPILAQMA